MSMLSAIFKAVYAGTVPPSPPAAEATEQNWRPEMADPRIAAIADAAITSTNASGPPGLNAAVDRLLKSRGREPVIESEGSDLDAAVERLASHRSALAHDALKAAVDQASLRVEMLPPAQNDLERAVDRRIAQHLPPASGGLSAAVGRRSSRKPLLSAPQSDLERAVDDLVSSMEIDGGGALVAAGGLEAAVDALVRQQAIAW